MSNKRGQGEGKENYKLSLSLSSAQKLKTSTSHVLQTAYIYRAAFQSEFLMNYKCSRFPDYTADNMDTKGSKMATFLPKQLLLYYTTGVFNSLLKTVNNL